MLYPTFQSHGGILSTRELHALSLSSRQIARLVSEESLRKSNMAIMKYQAWLPMTESI